MSKQSTKTQLLADIKTERNRLENCLAQLSPEDMLLSRAVSGWSVKDILAHLTAWEQLFLGWYQAGLRNETPEPSPVGMSHMAINRLNLWIHEEHKHDPLNKVLAEFQTSYQQTLTVIEAIPEEDLFAHNRFGWTGRWTVADYIVGNTCNHYRWAKSKIRELPLTRSRSKEPQDSR